MKYAKTGRHAANNWPMRSRDLTAFRAALEATARSSARTSRAIREMNDALLNVQHAIRYGIGRALHPL